MSTGLILIKPRAPPDGADNGQRYRRYLSEFLGVIPGSG